jgi:hypothetical protein
VNHTTFKDLQGRLWDVWRVHPSAAERRFVDRRVNDQDLTGTTERRTGLERRGGVRKSPRASVAEEFAHGWLCFERAGEKRRLAPVPEGWDHANEKTLRQWCDLAKPAMRRNTGALKRIP